MLKVEMAPIVIPLLLMATPTVADVTSELDDQFHEPDHGTGDLLVDSSFAVR